MKLIKTTPFAVLVLLVALPFTAGALTPAPKPSAAISTTAAANAVPMVSGEVKKVDKDAGKLTIKHGPITNLAMPAMTMMFRVKDAAMLGQVKPGDKVRFMVERASGALTVSEIHLAK